MKDNGQPADGSCSHEWRIIRQVRNGNSGPNAWSIRYQCTRCGMKRAENRHGPVCEACGGDLREAFEGDKEADDAYQREVDKGMADAIAYRCKKCAKIHIIPYLE